MIAVLVHTPVFICECSEIEVARDGPIVFGLASKKPVFLNFCYVDGVFSEVVFHMYSVLVCLLSVISAARQKIMQCADTSAVKV